MLRGKTAIVTGSTSGIGLGIARALAQQGANVLLNGFGDRAAIDTLRVQIMAEYKVGVAYSPADMSRSADVSEMIAECTERFGGVDILVNNAGIQHTAPVEEFPDEQWEQILAINLSSAFYARSRIDTSVQRLDILRCMRARDRAEP
jgi:3-hydroxybutyrate dehydrogenase